MNKSFFQEILEKINEHQDSSIIEELSYHFSQTPDNEQCGEAVGIISQIRIENRLCSSLFSSSEWNAVWH